MSENPSQRESDTPIVDQPQSDIHVMPEQFLSLTRSKDTPRQVMPAEKPAEPAPTATAAPAASAPSPTPKAIGLEQPKEPGMRRTLILWGAIGGGVIVIGGIIAFFVLRSVPSSAPVSATGGSASGGNTPPVNTAPPAPVNEPPPAPTNTPPVNVLPVVEPPPVVEPEVPANVDRDNDGLTDAEENVLGTDVSVADTDSDGYDDRTELLNLYNPTGIAPQKLLDAGLVFEYENPRDGWRIFVPRTWSIAATDQEQREVVISTGVTGEEIVASVMEGEVGVGPALGAQQMTSKRGVIGFRDETGGGGVFLQLSDSLILTLVHRISNPPARFPTIFEMIVQSVAFAGAR